ncbi:MULTISPECIES: TetR/AcrR family transcriptional regulator [Pseudonocardia]|uniref:Transcriptional regulator BetI n=2 Tax=Pseudonocardia TaxID=1847 RepID=A0A1Y2MVL2_PSEAH|nr:MULTISPECIES: TetR/AcrR family transcriptional regulator [Pseudonocardia]OSY39216.1 transcriptional regulator BetI [Pseudonocardia autotrophica]TDN76562.1 TetR family transcriptional regulator [Pseudonocardia autotrophica]BBG00562.1 hypothetical protein Pdca_17710 [Pseudonocardia autotrophica]GEC28464.1 hypothetical protein PSA01_54930 [Pseudonocardia saturnea]
MGDRTSTANTDLTARARIRDAALEHFAAHGVERTTIRGVATAAGVSHGLVQHHFGSKENLRRACDEYAAETIRRTKDEAGAGGMADPGFLADALRTAMPVRRYIARALIDGSPSVATLFDDEVAHIESYLADPRQTVARPRTSDLHAYAVAIAAMNFGFLALHEQLSRTLGEDTLTPEGSPRFFRAVLDVLAEPLFTPEFTEQSRATLDRLGNP